MEPTNTGTEEQDRIKKINDLNKQVIDLEYAINIFKPEANIIRGSGSRDIMGVIKLERRTKLSIFGSRWFGIGTHEKEIELPSTMIDDVQKLMIDRCELLRNERNRLLFEPKA